MKKDLFVSKTLEYLGCPSTRYKRADIGDMISGFDCSGFIKFLLNICGYPEPIPRHCNELFDSFGIFIHYPFREAGDLIFFSLKSGGRYPDHVGILVSRDEYIHSPGKNGEVIRVSKLEPKDIKTRHVTQIYSFNPIGVKRITIKSGRYQRPFLS